MKLDSETDSDSFKTKILIRNYSLTLENLNNEKYFG